jgi:hypothetical protein
MEDSKEADLTALTTLSLEDLREVLLKEEKARRTNIQLMVGIGIALVTVYALMIVVQIATRSDVDWTFLMTQMGLIGCFTSVWGLSQKHKQALNHSTQWQDPAMAPHLLEVLDADSKDIREACEAALSRLLPLVTLEHASLFELQQLKGLMKLAETNKTELAESAVRALGKVGNMGTPQKLESFANRRQSLDPFDQRLSTLALQAAADLRLEQARRIVSSKTAEVGAIQGLFRHESLELPKEDEIHLGSPPSHL